jgi:hypothetical protein
MYGPLVVLSSPPYHSLLVKQTAITAAIRLMRQG